MTQFNLYEAKTHLSALVERVEAGEEIVIAKNGKPRVKIVALNEPPATVARRKRQFGFWDHYGWQLPADFDDPDPELEALFYGEHPEST